jgi:hypothetical protein
MKPCQYNCEVSFPYTPGQCRICWNYAYSPRHKALWDASPSRPVNKWACDYRGDEVGAVRCDSCSGTVMVKVFQCTNQDVPEQRCALARKVPDTAVCAACSCRSIRGQMQE